MNTKQNLPPGESARSAGRLIIVSNRLPVVLLKNSEGNGWSSETGSGGLVSAMMPVLRDRGGVWVGWPGVADDATSIDDYLKEHSKQAGYRLQGVYLSKDEIESFYEGFSNEIIWPLFHDLPVDCHFDPTDWCAYREVNRKFAEKIAECLRPNDIIWVHDYHLIGIAGELRRLGVRNTTGFFLHIPSPAPDLFLKLPWPDGISRISQKLKTTCPVHRRATGCERLAH